VKFEYNFHEKSEIPVKYEDFNTYVIDKIPTYNDEPKKQGKLFFNAIHRN